MSVLNRKLFSQREARTKLRDMGGIMSSSPELSGEVQRFQNGMMVRPQPRPDRAPQLVEPPATVPSVSEEARDQARQLWMDTMFGWLQGPAEAVVSTGEAVGRVGGAIAGGLGDVLETAAIAADDPNAVEDLSAINARIDRWREGDREEEDVALEPDMTADGVDTTDDDRAARTNVITPERIEDETNAAISELTTALGDGDAEEEDPDTLRSRYQQRLELFQEVFGSDEPTARDRAMQLAMIGLAIASGQSPNALQNIASGALAGMQAMSQQERERRNQQRELRSLAIESAMQDISEERRLTAREERATAQREAAIREAYDEAYSEAVDRYDRAGDVQPGESMEEYAERHAQASLARRFGPTLGTGTTGLSPEESQRIAATIEAQRDQGRSDAEIARMLREAGISPEEFGIEVTDAGE